MAIKEAAERAAADDHRSVASLLEKALDRASEHPGVPAQTAFKSHGYRSRRSLAPSRGLVSPFKLAHIVRRTSRFDAMVAWYQVVLGAHSVHSDGMLAFLTYDDEHHRVAIANLPGLADQPEFAAGTEHVAFTYADLGDLLYTYARLADEGIAPYWCINHGTTTSVYYKDPDGSRVELQVDNFPTAEDGVHWMRSDEFAANRSASSSSRRSCSRATEPASRSNRSRRSRRSRRARPRSTCCGSRAGRPVGPFHRRRLATASTDTCPD